MKTKSAKDFLREVRPLLNWLSANPALAVSGAGGFLFLFISSAQRSALKPFGVTPADVGIDYTTTIWGALPSFIIVAGTVSVFSRTVIAIFQKPSEPMSRQSLVAVAYLVLLPIFMAVQVEQLRYVRVVRQGRHYEPLLSPMSPVTLRADSVQIAWKESSESKTSLPSGRLLLLGVASGAAVIFEADTFRTWRIPMGDLVIVTDSANAAQRLRR